MTALQIIWYGLCALSKVQMNTRKRKLSAVDHTALSVLIPDTQTKPSTAACGSLSDPQLDQLRQIGCTKNAISAVAAATLYVAAKAFRGQLEVFSKQLPDDRYIGFHTSPGVQRLEYRPGHEALGDLGILQHLIVTSTMPSSCQADVEEGLLTLIYSDAAQSIQVMDSTGAWTQLTVPEGQIAVLAGYTLERATCGLITAAKHRMVATPGGPLACNALVYKLRSPDTAVLDMYAALSKHHTGKIDPRHTTSIDGTVVRQVAREAGMTHLPSIIICNYDQGPLHSPLPKPSSHLITVSQVLLTVTCP
ncbi:hypothetical protein WJX82_000928 [Trebouxia sp. C0006]